MVLLMSCKKQDTKQFSLLSSDNTAITYSNDIVETDSLNYFSYPYMYMGGGAEDVSFSDVKYYHRRKPCMV